MAFFYQLAKWREHTHNECSNELMTWQRQETPVTTQQNGIILFCYWNANNIISIPASMAVNCQPMILTNIKSVLLGARCCLFHDIIINPFGIISKSKTIFRLQHNQIRVIIFPFNIWRAFLHFIALFCFWYSNEMTIDIHIFCVAAGAITWRTFQLQFIRANKEKID